MKDALADSVFDKVQSFINYTNQNIFLTGKAGTGKTTLLKQIREKSARKMVVVAPTGVAAMNAKGITINSFFQLPPGSFFPGDIDLGNLQSGILSISSVVSNLSFTRDKIKLFNNLELLVIDEISMVRCDLMDVIDAILRSVRNNNQPFGGLQLLLIGDLYQLPPVTKREDWSVLSKAYPSPYFFDSYVIRRYPLLQIELTRVFRQTEPEFINILNDIRNNQINARGLELLNQRYDPDLKATADIKPIIITSHNAEANAINSEKLNELPGPEYTFEGEVSGEFRDAGIQAEQSLKLKEAAQIMFIKNDTGDDRKYYNGKIGKVKSVNATEICISFPDEEDLLLEKSSWQSFEYKSDPEQVIVQQQVGEFFQYPIKLAWAVTIHKSQGLTFDHAIIDAGKSFVAGQVYVALSRVRTLKGLILRSRIGTDSLRSNPEVINYMNPAKSETLDEILKNEKERYILQLVLDHFNFQPLNAGLETIINNPEIMKSKLPEFKIFVTQLKIFLAELITLSDKFQNQIRQLFIQNGLRDLPVLNKRIAAAEDYFRKEITIQLLNQINKHIRVKPKNKIQQQIQHLLQKYRQVIENRLAIMQSATMLFEEPLNMENHEELIAKLKAQVQDRPDSVSGLSAAVTLQLF